MVDLAAADQLAGGDIASLESACGVDVNFPVSLPGTLVADGSLGGSSGLPDRPGPRAGDPTAEKAGGPTVALQAKQVMIRTGVPKVHLALTGPGREELSALAKAHRSAKLSVTFSFTPSAAGTKTLNATGTVSLPVAAPAPALYAGLGAATFTDNTTGKVDIKLAAAERALLLRAAAHHQAASFDVFLAYRSSDGATEVVEKKVTLASPKGAKGQVVQVSAIAVPASGSCVPSPLPATTASEQKADESQLASELAAGLSGLADETPAQLASDPTLSFAGASLRGASASCSARAVEEGGVLGYGDLGGSSNAAEVAPVVDPDAIGAASTLADLGGGEGPPDAARVPGLSAVLMDGTCGASSGGALDMPIPLADAGSVLGGPSGVPEVAPRSPRPGSTWPMAPGLVSVACPIDLLR